MFIRSGIERADAQRRDQPRSITTVEPTCSSVGGDLERRLGAQAVRRGLGGEALGARACAARSRRPRSCGVPSGATTWRIALDPHGAGALAHRDRLGDVLQARRPRRRRARAGRRAPRRARARRRSRPRPARRAPARAARRRRTRRGRRAPGSSCSVCIGTAISAKRARERRSRRRRRARSRPPAPAARGALGEHGEQLAVAVERGDVVPVAGEPQRDAARAGADVEHRAARLARQLAPQRQVGVVAAALDVVPDHVRGDAHRQYSFAWPRRASSSRSSSSAV